MTFHLAPLGFLALVVPSLSQPCVPFQQPPADHLQATRCNRITLSSPTANVTIISLRALHRLPLNSGLFTPHPAWLWLTRHNPPSTRKTPNKLPPSGGRISDFVMEQRGAPEFILEAFADPNSVREVVRGTDTGRPQALRFPLSAEIIHDPSLRPSDMGFLFGSEGKHRR